MSIPGMRQGFLIYGTLAHQILLMMHEYGPQSIQSVCEGLKDGTAQSRNAIAGVITQMCKYKFIRNVGRARVPGTRSHSLYHYKWVKVTYDTQIISPKDRTAAYRLRKGVQVNSVFDFRGIICTNSDT